MTSDLGTEQGTELSGDRPGGPAGDVAGAVAVRLSEVAGRARPGLDTAERAAALDRHRHRRPLQWAAAALVAVLLVSGAALSRSAVAPAEPEATATRQVWPRPPIIYQAPVRGSLADDADFLAAMTAREWSSPYGPDGEELTPFPSTRRVVYAADVPGGARWAVVVARTDLQWLVAWFTGPRGATPEEMELGSEATPLLGSEPLVLMDVSEETGPVVVLGEPGDGAEYSPSLDRAPDGQLVRDFQPLPVVDGVPTGEVTMPITYNAAELYVVRGDRRSYAGNQFAIGIPPWIDTTPPAGPTDDALFGACLTEFGFDVVGPGANGGSTWSSPGAGVSWSDPQEGQLTSAEQAVRDRQVDACIARATVG